VFWSVPRARQREFDLAVAACALTSGAALWTLDTDDFLDIPGLSLFRL
jgi:predicted nucleic acid-binding protein